MSDAASLEPNDNAVSFERFRAAQERRRRAGQQEHPAPVVRPSCPVPVRPDDRQLAHRRRMLAFLSGSDTP